MYFVFAKVYYCAKNKVRYANKIWNANVLKFALTNIGMGYFYSESLYSSWFMPLQNIDVLL